VSPYRVETVEGFHLVHDPVDNRPFRGRFGPTVSDPCALTRAEARPAHPVSVVWGMGGAIPTDVVWTTMVAPLIVGPRVLQLLETGGFTGWDTYPVDLVDKAGRPVRGYAGLMITGRCDSVDLSKSEIVLRQCPGGWYPQVRGYFVDRESWDGTDVFMDRPDSLGRTTLFRLVSARLVCALREASIKNLRFEAAADVESALFAYQIGSAHRLPPDWESRVTELYARHGVPRPARE
jgi:hypothetical protein